MAPDHISHGNTYRRILIVEDDMDVRRLNTIFLLRSGYQVDAAEDGEAGWAALHTNDYDLLVTDNEMPRLSGLGLVKQLRFANMVLPVILASATSPWEEQLWDPSLNLAATLLKPFPPGRLVETVQRVLEASALARSQLSPLPTRIGRFGEGVSCINPLEQHAAGYVTGKASTLG